MSSASVTNIPTGPQSVPESDVGVALRLVDKLTDQLGGVSRDPNRSAFVVAVLTSVLLWGAHEVLGGRAATERHEGMKDRIEALEKQQTEIRIQLASIARAVGAE